MTSLDRTSLDRTSVVVTGASTGIGWGCVKVLADRGFHVFGSVRKTADAERLSEEFREAFTPLIFDVTDAPAVAAAARQVEARLAGSRLAGLVNNAGIANPGPLLHIDLDSFRQQLEVNVTGQLIVTQAFAPLLGAGPQAGSAPPGRIIMMSSVGGRVASPFVGAYNASKFALEGLSEALRRELMLFGVDVIIIAPGAIATPIWEKADGLDTSRYDTTAYAPSLSRVKAYMVELGRKGFAPERIGQTVWTALTARRPQTRYVVTPEPLTNWMSRHMPRRLIDRVIAGRLGLTRA
jgi:NAD(P)-dependent dehydrogenase (short-subunit alcohol dehydrogenase family)